MSTRQHRQVDLGQMCASPVERISRKLEELPVEMLAQIAGCLPKEDLISIRRCSNRAIRDGIDFVFVKEWFTHRKFKTSLRGILQFQQLALSRFAEEIRKVEIELRVDIPTTIKRSNINSLAWSAEPCRDAFTCGNMMCSVLTKAFRETRQLNHLMVQAPWRWIPRMVSDVEFTNQIETLVFQEQTVGAGNEPLSHWNIKGYLSPRAQFHSIFTATAAANVVLDHFEMLGFTQHPYTAALFAPTTSILLSLVNLPSLRTLSSFSLELDIFVQNNSMIAMEALVQILQNNASLKNLKLHLQPAHTLIISRAERMEVCAPLLTCLGSSPPFRLRSLSLEGLCTSGNMTLDRIVQAHQSTLEALVLESTCFNHPNSMRNLVMSLLDTNVELFTLRSFIINQTWVLKSGHIFDKPLQDDCLKWSDGKDESYKDWMEVVKDFPEGSEWVRYDYRGWHDGKEEMKKDLADIIVQIDCGSAGGT